MEIPHFSLSSTPSFEWLLCSPERVFSQEALPSFFCLPTAWQRLESGRVALPDPSFASHEPLSLSAPQCGGRAWTLCGLEGVEMGFQFRHPPSCWVAWPYIWASRREHGFASPDSRSVWLFRGPLVSGSRPGSRDVCTWPLRRQGLLQSSLSLL